MNYCILINLLIVDIVKQQHNTNRLFNNIFTVLTCYIHCRPTAVFNFCFHKIVDVLYKIHNHVGLLI